MDTDLEKSSSEGQEYLLKDETSTQTTPYDIPSFSPSDLSSGDESDAETTIRVPPRAKERVCRVCSHVLTGSGRCLARGLHSRLLREQARDEDKQEDDGDEDLRREYLDLTGARMTTGSIGRRLRRVKLSSGSAYGHRNRPSPKSDARPDSSSTTSPSTSPSDEITVLDMSLFPSFLSEQQSAGPTANRQAPVHPLYPSSQQQQQQQQQQHPGGPHAQSQVQGQQLQQQQQQQQNGYSMGGGGAVGGGAGLIPTAAGHQLDLNHLWGQVQELSELLERNKESTHGIMRRVGEVRSRASAADGLEGEGEGVDGILKSLMVNGDGENGAPKPDLHTRVHDLETSNEKLEDENVELATLVSTYEMALARILDQLRIYAHEHTLATLAIHKNYTRQLATERSTNLELRQEYSELQSRLGGLAGLVREGLKWDEGTESREEEGLKSIEAWAEVQNENRVMRGLIGLPPVESGDAVRS